MKKVKIFENDGRAPDTVTALGGTPSPKKAAAQKSRGAHRPRSPIRSHAPTPSNQLSAPKKAGRGRGRQQKLKVKEVGSQDSDLILQSYEWSRNSCWFDHTLEVIYCAYSGWPQDTQEAFRQQLPPESYLFRLVSHFNTRRKLSADSQNGRKLLQELQLLQEVTRRKLIDVWKVNHAAGDTMGDASAWFQVALQVRV